MSRAAELEYQRDIDDNYIGTQRSVTFLNIKGKISISLIFPFRINTMSQSRQDTHLPHIVMRFVISSYPVIAHLQGLRRGHIKACHITYTPCKFLHRRRFRVGEPCNLDDSGLLSKIPNCGKSYKTSMELAISTMIISLIP